MVEELEQAAPCYGRSGRPRTTSAWLVPIMLAITHAADAWAGEPGPARPSAAGWPVETEREFLADSGRAMDRMMVEMSSPPVGDVDIDFVNTMEPHHRGAVNMAIAELRYGRNAQLKRIAQEIIVEQLQEINAMRVAIDRPLLTMEPVPTQPANRAEKAQAPASRLQHHAHREPKP